MNFFNRIEGYLLGAVIIFVLLFDFITKSFKHTKFTLGVNMRFFNALQLVTLFGAMPFLLNWLVGSPFPYAPVAFWLALVAYIALYVWITIMVYSHLEKENKS